MILFEVTGKWKHRSVTKYIIAPQAIQAEKKFKEICGMNVSTMEMISIEYLCLRDDIVPTIDPKQEFKDRYL